MPDISDSPECLTSLRLSVVVSTRNEAENLPGLLANVADVDEIVIGDMESADGTVDLARQAGAVVVELGNAGYAEPGRMTAIEAASGDWVLVLDADERLAPGSLEAIRALCAESPRPVVAYRIPRVNYLGSRAIRGSGWDPEFERHARLFRAGSIDWGPELHSRPTFDGKVLDLPDEGSIRIDHANFRDFSHLSDKLNDYSSIEAQAVVQSGRTLVLPMALRFAFEELVNRYDPRADGSFSLALSLALFGSRFAVGAKIAEAGSWPDEEAMTIARDSLVRAVNQMWAELRRLEIQRLERHLVAEHREALDGGRDDGAAGEGLAELAQALSMWREQPPTLAVTAITEVGIGFDGPWAEAAADDAAGRTQLSLAHAKARRDLRDERRGRIAAEAAAADHRADAEEALRHLAEASAALAKQLWLNEQMQHDLCAAQSASEASEERALRAELAAASFKATGRRLLSLTRQRLRPVP